MCLHNQAAPVDCIPNTCIWCAIESIRQLKPAPLKRRCKKNGHSQEITPGIIFELYTALSPPGQNNNVQTRIDEHTEMCAPKQCRAYNNIKQYSGTYANTACPGCLSKKAKPAVLSICPQTPSGVAARPTFIPLVPFLVHHAYLMGELT